MDSKGNETVREKKGIIDWTRMMLFILVPLYHLAFVSGFLPLLRIYINSQQHRAMSLGSFLALTLLIYPFRKGQMQTIKSWYNIMFVFAGIVPCFYIFFFYDLVIEHQGMGFSTNLEIFLCLALIISLFEGTRRTVGIGMAIIAVGLIGYNLTCQFFPGMFHGKEFDIDRVVYQLMLTNEGIFGMPTGVAATIIITFIIFGQFYQVFGGGEFLSNLSARVAGRYTGGAGKVAVIASALMGTMTGSTTANIAAVGSFTIPMMIKGGYRREFAAGVEAVASNGGQIMPPVMGAVAFIIAEWLSIPYLTVCAAAVLPAIVYFAVLYIQIDLEARRLKLVGLPKDKIPSFKDVMRKGWFHIIPFCVLIYFLIIVGYTPEKACLYGLFSIFLVHLIKNKGCINFKEIMKGFETSAKAAPAVVTSCASASIIISVVLLTGLGFRISAMLAAIGGENVLLLLLLAAFACFALGFGVGSIAGYIIVALLIAPALIKAGILPLAAHLFVFYWSLTGFITPPVAVGAFVAAAVAEASPWRTAFVAIRLGVITFLVPFIFATNPGLLLKGTLWEIVWVTLITMVASFFLAIGLSGHLLKSIDWYLRLSFFVGSSAMCLAMVIHLPWLLVPSTGLCLAALAWQIHKSRSGTPVFDTISE
jgi:TRAP transporter 4TM/12TM fusion protein